jgi:hypothetical protein
MSLLQSEVTRIRAELGYHVLTVDAEPYISYVSLFDQIIQPYLSSGATTTSSTAVAAATTPTPVGLVLADATDFVAGARVVIDVDSRQEIATVQSVSGSTITVMLTKVHSGSYPVTLEGGESLVRETLRQLSLTREQRGKSGGRGALKEVIGDVSWYDTNKSAFESSNAEIMVLRDELAALLGVPNMWRMKAAAGQRLSVY